MLLEPNTARPLGGFGTVVGTSPKPSTRLAAVGWPPRQADRGAHGPAEDSLPKP